MSWKNVLRKSVCQWWNLYGNLDYRDLLSPLTWKWKELYLVGRTSLNNTFGDVSSLGK